MQDNKEVVSLFSGAGGLDFAFESTGLFTTTLYVESEPLFAETLRLNQRLGNLGAGRVVEADIATLDPVDTWTNVASKKRRPFAIVGGPPCESFSAMGKQKGRSDDRGKLIFSFADWVERLPAQVFLMENVPGLLTIERGNLFRDLLERFEGAGYAVSHAVLRAADYGAPTVRRRLFVVGTRGLPKFVFPPCSHGDLARRAADGACAPWVTSASVLSGLPPPSACTPGHPQGHVLIKHTPNVAARFKRLVPGTVDRIRKRNRLHPDLPAPGLYAGNLAGIRSHIHPSEPRELTNREAARIQGFPDSYLFHGSRVPVGKQIANAVPIALARALAGALTTQYGASQRAPRMRPRRTADSRERYT